MDCLFCKIANGTIPSEIVYQDNEIIAFRDVNPQAPQHTLIIPRKHIPTVNDFSEEDGVIFGRMGLVAKTVAKRLGVDESGYRLVVNCNGDGGQTVFHLHMHLLAGRQLAWPPG
ncbi:MAG: histidine triad nucleotide-binding protein [Gammaproteobacteria bacterium]|nr:histidine triad nucleotide-binding protein [Gammaproteobacteria bacterium]